MMTRRAQLTSFWKREVVSGQRVPWWMGCAYVRWDRVIIVCFPIPINLLVRWLRDLYFLVKSTQSIGWWDSQQATVYQKGLKDGNRQIEMVMEHSYQAGYNKGLVVGRTRTLDELEQLANKEFGGKRATTD